MLWCGAAWNFTLCTITGVLGILACLIPLPFFIIFLRMNRKVGHIPTLLHRIGPIMCFGKLGFFLNSFDILAIRVAGDFLLNISFCLYLWICPMVCYHTIGALYGIARQKQPNLLPLLYCHLVCLIIFAWTWEIEYLANDSAYSWGAFILLAVLTYAISLPLFWYSYYHILSIIKQSKQNIQSTGARATTTSGRNALNYQQRFQYTAYSITLGMSSAMIVFLFWFVEFIHNPRFRGSEGSQKIGTQLFVSELFQIFALGIALWTCWLPLTEYFEKKKALIELIPPPTISLTENQDSQKQTTVAITDTPTPTSQDDSAHAYQVIQEQTSTPQEQQSTAQPEQQSTPQKIQPEQTLQTA